MQCCRIDFAGRYAAAWCSQDPTSVAGFYSPGGLLSVNNDVPAVGRSAITEVAQSFMTAFPGYAVMMDEVLVHRYRIAYHWTLIGTYTTIETIRQNAASSDVGRLVGSRKLRYAQHGIAVKNSVANHSMAIARRNAW